MAPGGGPTWDAGTGNGQAAVDLAAGFAPVFASDMSASQLRAASPHADVRYLAGRAEAAPFRPQSFRLITVAQAAHWFDLDGFFHEVLRVLQPAGVVVLWSYGSPTLPPDVDAIYRDFWSVTLADHWPAGRRIVEEGYAGMSFPRGLEDLPAPSPPLEIREAWGLERILGYARTWSGTRRLMAAGGTAELASFERALTAAWGDPTLPRPIRWPLAVRAARRASAR
jgi:SAM-dependent methyltransferase